MPGLFWFEAGRRCAGSTISWGGTRKSPLAAGLNPYQRRHGGDGLSINPISFVCTLVTGKLLKNPLGQGEAAAMGRAVGHSLPVHKPPVAGHAKAQAVERCFLSGGFPVARNVCHTRAGRHSQAATAEFVLRLRGQTVASESALQLLSATHRKPTAELRHTRRPASSAVLRDSRKFACATSSL
jgi:hypothetical protein